MRFLLVLAFVAMASAGTILRREDDIKHTMSTKVQEYYQQLMDHGGEIEIHMNPEEGYVEVAPQFIVSWQVKRLVRKMQKQMPCGFPEVGIPPLAPLKVSEGAVKFEKGGLDTYDEFYHFLLYGLDKFKVEQFKLNVFSSKITFSFLFPSLDASVEKYWTDTILDALQQYGLKVEYQGSGAADVSLKNLRISGVLNYKMPVIVGSIKITELTTTVSVEKCTCDLEGFLGHGQVNEMVNSQIETFVVNGINNNQEAISNLIEQTVVPVVNQALKGKDFWTILDIILSSIDGENEDDPIVVNCDPPANPWS